MGVRGHPRPAGSGTVILCCLLVAGTAVLPLHAITQLDFFQSYGKGEILRQGDSEFEMVKLDPPMPFFSQTFDHIYVRRSGEHVYSSSEIVAVIGAVQWQIECAFRLNCWENLCTKKIFI